MNRFTLIFLAFPAFLWSCSEDCSFPDELEDTIPIISIERLEDQLFSMNTQSEILNFLNQRPILKNEFMGSDQYPNDTILANELYKRVQNPYIDSLREEAAKVFGNMDEFRQELGMALAIMKSYYPQMKIPKIQTMVTGFGTSEMYVSDSLIIIGLDYYLGPDASFRPNQYPNYILKRYQKPYIVPAILLMLSEQYVKTDYQDNTMLADMVYYGKKYHFTKSMIPCTPDSLIIWYSTKELADVTENQHIIWATFLQNELLFETNHITKEKFMGERPNTYEISAICPGRIGAWVGWEIVRKYASGHPEVSFQEIMEQTNALQLFNDSNYKGKAPGLF